MPISAPTTVPTGTPPVPPAEGGLVPPTARPSSGLRAPARRVAAARARYQTDGATGLSGGRLVVALFERLQRDLHGAEAAIGNREIESAHQQLVHAQEIVESLDDALDAEVWEHAPRLSALYRHLDRELVMANIRKDAAVVVRCRQLVDSLAATWEEAAGLAASPTPTGAES